MKFCTRLVLIFSLLPAVAGHSASLSPRQQSTLAPALASRVATDPAGTEYEILVRFGEPNNSRQNLSNLAASAVRLTDRYHRVGEQLRNTASMAVPSVSGQASVIRRFWIANVAEMRVDKVALLGLADRDDVDMIAPNVSIELLDPVSIADAVSASAGAAANLAAIGARSLWVRGLTGKGRLVASLDTGVEGIHPALADRWHGKHGDTAASWFDPLKSPVPIDNNGHGTHVMGIMVGRDGADTIGLAPDAEWICAAVVDRGRLLSATFADILAALQWVVDPDGNPQTMDDVPDAVCNSWGVSRDIISPCDDFFFEAIDNVEAMGVVCVFAAGNEGPYTMSIRNPADRATSPTASFSVGAVDATTDALSVPGFSSRGPSACDGAAKKPEIAAPGVSIRSAYKGESYRIINGTSMAAPHVAAAVALIRQYNPELTPEEIKTALLATAVDIDAPGEDNASGKGMIDLAAAVASLPSPDFPVVSTGAVELNSGEDGVAAFGEDVALVVPVSVEVAEAENVTLMLSSISPQSTVTFGSAYVGTIPAGGHVSNASSPFLVHVSEDARAGDTAWLEVRMSGEPLLNWWRDTIGVRVGLPEAAILETSGDESTALTLSNFGQIGLADGSAFSAGGEGWQTSNLDANVLYEGALLISSADGGWVDASQPADGVRRFEFSPKPASAGTLCFDDLRADNSVGVTIDQTVSPLFRTTSYEVTTVTWTLHNLRGTRIEDLRFGLLVDIDLPAAGVTDEMVALDPVSGGFFHIAPRDGFVAGLAPLSGAFGGLNFFQNLGGKQALAKTAKQAAMQSKGGEVDERGDYFAVVATNPVDLSAGDSIVVAIAFISGNDAGAFSDAAANARTLWLDVDDTDGGGVGVRPPLDYRLEQNYPNPFNAGTTITVQIAGDGSRQARLEIVDVLGRRVRTLLNDVAAPGTHPLFWDGRNDGGDPVASGVYFARLIVAGQAQQVRSLVLLK